MSLAGKTLDNTQRLEVNGDLENGKHGLDQRKGN